MQFPVVRANTLDECGAVAMREASLLVTLLAAHRGSFGDVFCTIIHEQQTGRLLPGIHIPPYRGNLLGGFISGEEPEGLRRDLYAIQGDSTLQLFALLLGEAIRERRPEFRYVRLWSLLETVAKSRGCAGRPKRDWSGQAQAGKKGQALFVQEACGAGLRIAARTACSPRHPGRTSTMPSSRRRARMAYAGSMTRRGTFPRVPLRAMDGRLPGVTDHAGT